MILLDFLGPIRESIQYCQGSGLDWNGMWTQVYFSLYTRAYVIVLKIVLGMKRISERVTYKRQSLHTCVSRGHYLVSGIVS